MDQHEKKLIQLLERLPKKEVAPGFSDRVMCAVSGRRPGALLFADFKKWAIVSLAFVFLGLIFLTDLPLIPRIEVTQMAGYQKVELVFYAPSQDPKTVAVAGDFSDWDFIQMNQVGEDFWRVTMQIKPGKYQYSFVVDGSLWVPDPLSPRQVADGFGGFNSVLVVNGLSNDYSVE